MFLEKIKIFSKFKKHNQSFFSNRFRSNSTILVEFNDFKSSHIPISYLSNFLSKKFKANIVGYYNYYLIVSSLKLNIKKKMKWFISNLLSLNNFGIYKSFGCKQIIKPQIKNYIYFKYKRINTKPDILNICFDNILVGDLIYDTYLKKFNKPTVDLNDKKIYELIDDFYNLYLYWKKYFNENKVKSVIGVHTPYSFGLILRLAVKKNIPTFVTSNRFLYRLDKKMQFMHGNFTNYKNIFKKIRPNLREKAKNISKTKLLLRFSGIGGAKTDLITSQNSSFTNKKFGKKLIKNSKRIKILIAPHDFFDAAHVWGKNFFVDFYEWLTYLGKISEKTNYDWYLKNRPNHPGKFKIYQPHTNRVLKLFVKKFNKIKMLPNNYSHNQIISEGIDFVLTSHGSVGLEYAHFKIPVINATNNNPHINYNFNINPRDIKHYKYILNHLYKYKKFKKKIKLNDIYEYYFMRHIFYDKTWIVDNLEKMLDYVGGYDNQFTEKIYDFWLKNFTLKKHNNIVQSINKFYKSGDNSISIIHNNKIKKLLS